MRRLPLYLCCLSVVLGSAVACRHEPPPASPWVPAGTAPPPLWLAQTPLSDSAAIETITDSFGLLGAGDEGLSAMLRTSAQVPRARLQGEAGVRRWVALSVYRAVRSSDFAERFDAVRGLVDSLHAAAPDAPETVFCRALLRLALLEERDGKLVARGIERALIADLAGDLGSLAQNHPAWDGPGEFDRQRLLRDRQKVDALLASLSADASAVAAPASPSPTAAPATAPAPAAAPAAAPP